MKSETIKKIFSIGLGLACAVIILIICALLFSTTNLAIDTGLAFGSLLITVFFSVYLMPVVGAVFLVLAIMYAVKMVKYKEGKAKKVITILGIFVLLVITFVATYITLYQYLFTRVGDITDTMPFVHKTSGVITIILTIFLYITWTKQFKHIVDAAQEQIVQGDPINGNADNRNKKIIIAVIIIACVAGIVLFLVFDGRKDTKLTNTESEPYNQTAASDMIESEQANGESETYYVNEEDGFMVYLSNLWRDRYQVTIYKTEDHGENWEEVDTDLDEVYIGSEFKFLSEEIGFVHDPYGGVDSYDTVKITRDGGKTWKELSVNKPSSIKENNIFYKDLPEMVDGKLEIIAYTVAPAESQKYKYYKFESENLGKTWNYVGVADQGK